MGIFYLQEEMSGWHLPLNGHEFEQTPRDSEGQGSLAYCNPWVHKESDMIERLNNKRCQTSFSPYQLNINKIYCILVI